MNTDDLNPAYPPESSVEMPLRMKRQLVGLASGLPLSIMLASIAWEFHFSLYIPLCVVLMLTPAVFTTWWRSHPDYPSRRAEDSISSERYKSVQSVRRIAMMALIIATVGIAIFQLNRGHSNWSHTARPLWLMLSWMAYIYLMSIVNLCRMYREDRESLSLHLGK